MRRRDERGQITLLVIGLATILVMLMVVVVNASAAYLVRQDLDTLADGAALQGADLGATGVYAEGLTGERLDQRAQAVRQAVRDYLVATGAHRRYPGIAVEVRVDPVGRAVTVALRAPLDLPLRVPGAPARPVVGASSTAAVRIDTP